METRHSRTRSVHRASLSDLNTDQAWLLESALRAGRRSQTDYSIPTISELREKVKSALNLAPERPFTIQIIESADILSGKFSLHDFKLDRKLRRLAQHTSDSAITISSGISRIEDIVTEDQRELATLAFPMRTRRKPIFTVEIDEILRKYLPQKREKRLILAGPSAKMPDEEGNTGEAMITIVFNKDHVGELTTFGVGKLPHEVITSHKKDPAEPTTILDHLAIFEPNKSPEKGFMIKIAGKITPEHITTLARKFGITGPYVLQMLINKGKIRVRAIQDLPKKDLTGDLLPQLLAHMSAFTIEEPAEAVGVALDTPYAKNGHFHLVSVSGQHCGHFVEAEEAEAYMAIFPLQNVIGFDYDAYPPMRMDVNSDDRAAYRMTMEHLHQAFRDPHVCPFTIKRVYAPGTAAFQTGRYSEVLDILETTDLDEGWFVDPCYSIPDVVQNDITFLKNREGVSDFQVREAQSETIIQFTLERKARVIHFIAADATDETIIPPNFNIYFSGNRINPSTVPEAFYKKIQHPNERLQIFIDRLPKGGLFFPDRDATDDREVMPDDPLSLGLEEILGIRVSMPCKRRFIDAIHRWVKKLRGEAIQQGRLRPEGAIPFSIHYLATGCGSSTGTIGITLYAKPEDFFAAHPEIDRTACHEDEHGFFQTDPMTGGKTYILSVQRTPQYTAEENATMDKIREKALAASELDVNKRGLGLYRKK